MTTHLDLDDPRYEQAAAALLQQHANALAEANITSALRDFLIVTRLATTEQMREEAPPAPGSRQSIDLVATSSYIEVKRRIGTTSGLDPNPDYVRQLDSYLEQAHAQDGIGRMGVLTDGKHWLLRWAGAGPIRTAHPYAYMLENPNGWIGLYEWLRDKALNAYEGEIPTRESIANHFGRNAPVCDREIAHLHA